MKNKILASVILATLTLWAWVTLANTSTWVTNFTWSKKEQKFTQLTTEQKAEFEEIKTILEKKKAWTTLTIDEETKLKSFESKYPKKDNNKKWFGKKWDMWDHKMWMKWEHKMWMWFDKLTDAEKTSLEKMTDTEKKAFFEAKRLENETKAEAREAVIDKLISWTTLNDEEKKVLEEIKIERAEKKAKKAEMKEIRTIMEKKRAWTTLTADEEAKLKTFETNKDNKFDKR